MALPFILNDKVNFHRIRPALVTMNLGNQVLQSCADLLRNDFLINYSDIIAFQVRTSTTCLTRLTDHLFQNFNLLYNLLRNPASKMMD